MPPPEERSGLPALLGGIALFSTVEVASKQIGQRISPFEMVFIRFFVAGIVLLLISAPALRRIGPGLSRRDYSIFLLNGFPVTMSLTLHHAAIIAFEKGRLSAVVFSANPLFVLVLSRFINRSWARQVGFRSIRRADVVFSFRIRRVRRHARRHRANAGQHFLCHRNLRVALVVRAWRNACRFLTPCSEAC